MRVHGWGFYAMDDWKVSPKLTLNLVSAMRSHSQYLKKSAGHLRSIQPWPIPVPTACLVRTSFRELARAETADALR